MRRVAAVAALGLALVLAACGGGASDTSSSVAGCPVSGPTCVRVGVGQPIFLGTLLDESDPIGDDVAASVRLAIDYFDGSFDGVPGQVLGHDVTVLAEDDGCSALGGRTGAERLMQEAGLVAVIGTSCSSAALGAADVTLLKKNVLLVSASNTAPGLTAAETHQRNYFRIAFNDVIQASTVADFAFDREQWLSAMALHVDGDPYSTQLTGAFQKSFALLGGTALGDVGLADGGSPAAFQRRVAAAQPAMVFIAQFTPSCERTVSALRSDPQTRRIPIVVSEACQTRNFFDLLGPLAAGVYTSGPDFSSVHESAFYRQAYLPAYRRLVGGEPNGVYHPAAWDAVNLVMDALKRTAVLEPSGDLSINREALRRALLNVQGYDGMSGRLTCASSGDCAESARIAIYRAPNWPVLKGDAAKPIYSQLKTLAEVMNGG